MKLLWADIETTGLQPEYDTILATGLAVTDENLNILSEQQWILGWYSHREPMSEFIYKMHTDSGLIDLMKESELWHSDIEYQMCNFVKQHFKEGEDIVLAGNSIHFDRAFFQKQINNFYSLLYRREVDVSSLKVLMKMWSPDLEYKGGGPKHLPLNDLHGSIEELRHYRKMLFR